MEVTEKHIAVFVPNPFILDEVMFNYVQYFNTEMHIPPLSLAEMIINLINSDVDDDNTVRETMEVTIGDGWLDDFAKNNLIDTFERMYFYALGIFKPTFVSVRQQVEFNNPNCHFIGCEIKVMTEDDIHLLFSYQL